MPTLEKTQNVQTASSHFLQNTSLPPKLVKSAYYNVPKHLYSSWLDHIQKKLNNPPTKSKTSSSSSAFDPEQQLLENLFKSRDFFNEAEKKIILNFCSMLRIKANKNSQTNNTTAAKVDFLIDQTKQQLAQVIFLADEDLAKTASLIDLQNIPASLSRIQEQFEAKIQHILSSIQNHKANHEAVPIQDPALATSVLKPLAIAKMLMTSAGLLNLGLIDSIKQHFFDYSKDLIQYEKEVLQTLDDIEHSPLMQQQIQSIKKPESSNLPSNDLIRITLHLPPSVTPSDVQTKTVVLAALLSDMRQGDVGSCFATSVAILMMSSLKSKVISDIEQMITQGYITRKSATDQSDFIPVLDIGDSALESPLEINKDGNVILEDKLGYLWESPGIIAACRQLNISEDNVIHVIKNIIIRHYTTKGLKIGENTSITPDEIIKYLVERISSEKNFTTEQRGELHNLAAFAFSSETNTPLLRAWESCVASMAESQSNNYVRRKILNCVTTALDSLWPKSKSPFNGITEQAQKVQNVVEKILNTSIQLRYDPQVEIQPKESGDGHSKMLGAFMLHELEHGVKSISAKPIQNPSQFKEFVIKKINLSKAALGNSSDNNTDNCVLIVKNIQEYLSQPDINFSSFLKEAIRAYDDENKKILDPLQSWQTIEHLPFRDATGNENAVVYSKAIGISPGTPDTTKPKDATELLSAFITFGRSRAQTDQFLSDADPYQRYMADTPQHAFTLTPEDASIVDAMSSPQPPMRWIEEHITKPGITVANTPISQEQKINLINIISTEMIPKELIPAFKKQAATIKESANTIHLFSNAILDTLLTITSRKNDKTRAAFSRDLTNILINSFLPANSAKILTNTAARIADTNWVDQGVKHIYFSCFFDPLTKTLQLGTQDEDGNRLRALDQDEWVAYVPWEMYGIKLTPSLDNRKISVVEL